MECKELFQSSPPSTLPCAMSTPFLSSPSASFPTTCISSFAPCPSPSSVTSTTLFEPYKKSGCNNQLIFDDGYCNMMYQSQPSDSTYSTCNGDDALEGKSYLNSKMDDGLKGLTALGRTNLSTMGINKSQPTQKTA